MTLKMAEVSQQNDPHFNSELSRLRKDFWQQKMSSHFQVEWVLVEDADVLAWLKKNQQIDGLLFSEQFSGKILKSFREIPTDVKNIAVADCILKELGHHIPRILVKDALSVLMVEKSPELNTRGLAYVAGDSDVIKPAVAVAVKLGFSKISLVAADVDQAFKHAEFLRKKYFGINFLLIQDSELTMQPSNGDLLINTVEASQNPEFIDTISYMNFMRKGSLIADLPFSKTKNKIIEEAEGVEIPFILSTEVQAHKDHELLQRLQVSGLPSVKEYCSLWSEFLNQDKGPVT